MINFKDAAGLATEQQLITHYTYLIGVRPVEIIDWSNMSGRRERNKSYPNHIPFDVLGPKLKWMNENFPKEEYEWYLWFESIFLIPEEMYTFLALKWS